MGGLRAAFGSPLFLPSPASKRHGHSHNASLPAAGTTKPPPTTYATDDLQNWKRLDRETGRLEPACCRSRRRPPSLAQRDHHEVA